MSRYFVYIFQISVVFLSLFLRGLLTDDAHFNTSNVTKLWNVKIEIKHEFSKIFVNNINERMEVFLCKDSWCHFIFPHNNLKWKDAFDQSEKNIKNVIEHHIKMFRLGHDWRRLGISCRDGPMVTNLCYDGRRVSPYVVTGLA